MQLESDGHELTPDEADRTVRDLDVLISIFIDAILQEEPYVRTD
jgi:hypothetical protein